MNGPLRPASQLTSKVLSHVRRDGILGGVVGLDEEEEDGGAEHVYSS